MTTLYREGALYGALDEALRYYVAREELPDTLGEQCREFYDEVRGSPARSRSYDTPFASSTAGGHRRRAGW